MPGTETPDPSLRGDLRAIFAEADALVAHVACDASTDCCRFGVTGREPYVTALEVDEIRDALRASGRARAPKPPKVRLELADERRCPLLSEQGRCTVYDARPLGCRTFFCQAALTKSGGAKLPHAELRRLAREVEKVSARAHPEEQGTRPLTRVFGSG